MLTHLTSMMRRLSGLTALTALLAGVPWALVHFLGDTLPDRVPTVEQVTAALSSPLTDTILGGLLVSVLWVAWAAFAWSVIAEFAAVLAGIRLPQPRAFAPTRGLAAVLVAAITGGVLATAAQAAPPASAHAAAARTAPAATVVVAAPQTMPASVAQILAPQAPAVAEKSSGAHAEQLTLLAAGKKYTYTVQPGDNLSVIAKAWLGDGNRWPEIFALNRGQHFTAPSGTLTDPKVIRVGWTLELPNDAIAPADSRPADDSPAAEPPAAAPPSAAEPAAAPPTDGEPTGPTSAATPSPVTDDGVITSDETSSSPATDPDPAQSDQADVDDVDPAPEQQIPQGVNLPGGSWIDLGLVIAMFSAVALVWAHRRRRAVRRPVSPQRRLDEPGVEPMPEVISHVRRGLRHRRTAAQISHGEHRELVAYQGFFNALHETADAQPWEPVEQGADREDSPGVDQAYHAAHDLTAGEDFDDEDDDDEDGWEALQAPPPVVPALDGPFGSVWPSTGLGLLGVGAEPAARGFLVAALAAGGVHDYDGRAHVVIPSGTLATLLGAAAVSVPATPRLTVTPGLPEALALVEEQTLYRTRVVFDHEADSVPAVRDAHPHAEAMPPILLIADATTGHERARIAASLAQAHRLDIHGILLGDWPDGTTIDVAADGTTNRTGSGASRHGPHPADIARLTVLTAAQTADLLRILGESHTGQPQRPTPPTGGNDTPVPRPRASADDALPLTAEQDETTPSLEAGPRVDVTARADTGDLTGDDDAETTPAPIYAAVADTHDSSPARDGVTSTRPSDPSEEAETNQTEQTGDASAITTPARDLAADASAEASEGVAVVPVRVLTLGRPRITGVPAGLTMRRKSMELLVYLAVRDGTATQDEVLEDLLPHVSANVAAQRLHTFVYNMRTVLKAAGGDAEYLRYADNRFVLNPPTLDIDMWRMRDALAEAAASDDPARRLAALRRAVAAYTGPLADGRNYEWLEQYRYSVERQAIDAALALVDALVDEPEEARGVLATAIEHHPYEEALYQAAMRVHARRGDVDAIRALTRDLTHRLEDIDVEPTDDTTELAEQLIATARRHTRTRRPGNAPA